MIIYKFGGTSVGSAQRMKEVADIVTSDNTSKIVVLSAVSGTTNTLVEIGELLLSDKQDIALKLINSLHQDYLKIVSALYSSEQHRLSGDTIVNEHFDKMRMFAQIPDFNPGNNKSLLAFGEILSTNLFHQYLLERQVATTLIPALDFMSIDEDSEPEIEKIGTRLKPMLSDASIVITQGFICKNHLGQTDNLKRGGSDYSASIIGAAIGADEIQIWTDIDGMHNNDPRVVDNTRPIESLTFDEAAELAYFGAKILHPTSILPAQKYGIPVRLKNTMQPAAAGTLIGTETSGSDIKAIAAKEGITAIKVKSSRMLLAHGFLRNIFEVFNRYKTPIDMITTSEVAVSLTIDDDQHLERIVEDLQVFGHVEVDKQQTIICIVGNMVAQRTGILSKIFDALSDIPVRMVSYGGSRHNISLLIESPLKQKTLRILNDHLFR